MIETFDVIVVGGGGSGLAAAIEAATAGASVVLLEKNHALGGSTSWSVGAITATGTPHQARAGITDSAEAHFEDMGLLAGPLEPRDNLELRRLLVNQAGEMLVWLMSMGVTFMGPMPEAPHRERRMHNVVPNSKAFAHYLGRRCRSLGVDVRLDTRSYRLVEKDGRIASVLTKTSGGVEREYRARRGVVLAGGDYSNGHDLKLRFASPDIADVDAINVTATGDAHQMALELGACVLNGDIVRGPIMRFLPAPKPNFFERFPINQPLAKFVAWGGDHLPKRLLRPFFMSFLTTALGPSLDLMKAGAILINRDGRHFADDSPSPNLDVARQPGRIAWIVFDNQVATRFSKWPYAVSTAPGVGYAYLDDYRAKRPDLYQKSNTIAGLGKRIGVPRENLAIAVQDYNDGGRRDRPALVRAPFYALGPVKSYIVFTDGGLKVTTDLAVMRGDSIIPGLYAAGSTGQGGLLLEGHGHHLAWAFVSGRIAGRNAARANVAA